jgi:hypothetical protein
MRTPYRVRMRDRLILRFSPKEEDPKCELDVQASRDVRLLMLVCQTKNPFAGNHRSTPTRELFKHIG